jgi:hypothetical protein
MAHPQVIHAMRKYGTKNNHSDTLEKVAVEVWMRVRSPTSRKWNNCLMAVSGSVR